MLVIKSLLELPVLQDATSYPIPTYWDGKAWGKGLEWAATYEAIEDLPAKIGSAFLDSTANPLSYKTKEGAAIAVVEHIRLKRDIPQGMPCYYIQASIHIATAKDKIAILEQANKALANIATGCEVLYSEVKVIPDIQGSNPSSITTTPMILESATPLEQALQDTTTKAKPK